jgi:hypothetical protein
MIYEALCSKETYKLLRSKGYEGEMHAVCNMQGFTRPVITLSMAMRWLREVHNLFICIEYDPPVFSAEIYKMDEVDEYGSAKRIPPIFGNCKSFEIACEAAIKECLENII